MFLVRFVPQQFFPASDRPELTVDLTLRQNASIYATEEQVKKLEAILKADPDVDHFSTYVGRGAVRFILTLNVQLAQSVLLAAGRGRQGPRGARPPADQAREGAGRAVPGHGRARVAARTRAAGGLAAAVPRDGARQGRGAARSRSSSPASWARIRRPGTSTSTGWSRRGRSRSAINQDEARQLGISTGALAGIMNADRDRHRGHAGARRHLPRSTWWPARRAEQRLSLQTPEHPAGAHRQRPHGAAEPVRHLLRRAGVAAGLAPQPGADAHGARGRRPRRAARHRGRGAGAEDQGVQRQAAEGLQDRDRRPLRGKRRVERLGVRGGAAHDRADAAEHDGAAGELPAGSRWWSA